MKKTFAFVVGLAIVMATVVWGNAPAQKAGAGTIKELLADHKTLAISPNPGPGAPRLIIMSPEFLKRSEYVRAHKNEEDAKANALRDELRKLPETPETDDARKKLKREIRMHLDPIAFYKIAKVTRRGEDFIAYRVLDENVGQYEYIVPLHSIESIVMLSDPAEDPADGS